MMGLSVQYDEHAYLGGGYDIPKRGACQTEQPGNESGYRDARGIAD
jgi:hypothetical protein